MRQDVLRSWAREQLDQSKRDKKARKEIELLSERRARVEAQMLTQDPVWDQYLQRVEELQERDRAQLRPLEERLLSLDYLPDRDAAELRQRASVLRAQIDARTECLRIPRELLQEAPPAAS